LAVKEHPDKNVGVENAEERWIQIQRAYDVLSDDQERAHYDRFGTTPSGRGGFANQQPQSGSFHFSFGGGGSPFEHMFQQFFQVSHVRHRRNINPSLSLIRNKSTPNIYLFVFLRFSL
jgi:DnaJ-class molecular chaperone